MVADEMTGGNYARYAHAQQPFLLKSSCCVPMTLLMKRLVAAGLLSVLILLPTPAQAHWGVTWNLSIHHGDAVLGANVRRDLDKQTMTVTIRPGHAAVFTIELDRGRGEEPRLTAVITGCGGGSMFGVRWYTENRTDVTSAMAGKGYETPKMGGGDSAFLSLVVRASAWSAGSMKDCLIGTTEGPTGDKVLVRVRSHR
jgi:hypothetical protein